MSKARRVYGEWAGNPAGNPADITRCVVGVWLDMMEHQCARKRGHGKGGMYCRQHAEIEERHRTRQAQRRKWMGLNDE